jgi:adenosine deaminase
MHKPDRISATLAARKSHPARRQVPIEICLTSNVQTRAVESFEKHPLRIYYDEGLILSLNTDNRLMSATTVTEEYWRAHKHLGFTWDELVDITMMGFDSAFMHRTQKLEMCSRVRKEIESLTPAKA